jgi:hypothetical protein
MSILVGILLALPGGLAILAGLSAMRHKRRLRRDGMPTRALAVTPPAAAYDQRDGPAHRTLIQYQLTDGRVVERISPSLRPGQQVLVWYDPKDPQDILVYGREGWLADKAFVVVGALCMLGGAAIAAFAR